MSTILVFRDAPLPVLNAVLVACHQQRDQIAVNLAAGPKYAPQVNCSGSKHGKIIYHIETPAMAEVGALAVMTAANDAQAVYDLAHAADVQGPPPPNE